MNGQLNAIHMTPKLLSSPINFPKMKFTLHSRDNINHLSWCQPKDFSLTWFLRKIKHTSSIHPRLYSVRNFISGESSFVRLHFTRMKYISQEQFHDSFWNGFIETSKHHISMLHKYSRTSWYGHLSNTDSSLLRTVSYICTDKILIPFLKKTSIIRTLSNMDNGHKISALGSKFI